MNISGISKGVVLSALYNASHPLGMGFLHFKPQDMAVEEADKIIYEMKQKGFRLYFDYLHGRVMKVDISGDELGTSGYDRDNGQGAAERAITNGIAATNIAA